MEKIILKRTFLDEKASKYLKDLYCAEKSYQDEKIKELKHLILNNEVILFAMYISNQCIGYTLCRVDGRDFVVVAVRAYAKKRNLTEEVLPILEDLAINLNCDFVRIHTARNGLVKKLENQHYKASEVVMRKVL